MIETLSPAPKQLSLLPSPTLKLAGIDVFDVNVLNYLEGIDDAEILVGHRVLGLDALISFLVERTPVDEGLKECLEGVLDEQERKLPVTLDITDDAVPESTRVTRFHVDPSDYSATVAEIPALFLVDPGDPERYRNPDKSELTGDLEYAGEIRAEHVYAGEPGQLVGFRRGVVHARPDGEFNHRGLLLFDFSPY